jgi:hypothetical protein
MTQRPVLTCDHPHDPDRLVVVIGRSGDPRSCLTMNEAEAEAIIEALGAWLTRRRTNE